MNEQETIADIIAEMRALSNPISDGIIAIDGRIIADRLEAAHRRERGDCAKLREAVVEIIDYLEPIRKWTMPSKEKHTKLTALFAAADTVYTKAKTALAAPARNCDRFTTETDAQIAFLNEVCFIGVTTLKDDPFDSWTNLMKERYAEWLYAIATEKEGGNK